jgi:hypothetical protein
MEMSGEEAVLLVDAAESEVEDLSPIAGPVLRIHKRCFVLAPIGDGMWRRLSGTITCLSTSQSCGGGVTAGCDVAAATSWESLPAVREFLMMFPDDVRLRDSTVLVDTDLFGLFAVRERHLDRMQNYSVGQMIIVTGRDGGGLNRLAAVTGVADGKITAEYVGGLNKGVTRPAVRIARFEKSDFAVGKIGLTRSMTLIAADGQPLCRKRDEWAKDNTRHWVFFLSVLLGPLVPFFLAVCNVWSRTHSERVRLLQASAWGMMLNFVVSQIVWAVSFSKQQGRLQDCEQLR